MAKNKSKKCINGGLDSHFWEELKRKTIIDSTASSLRLSGVKITNEKVEQIINSFRKTRRNRVSHKNHPV